MWSSWHRHKLPQYSDIPYTPLGSSSRSPSRSRSPRPGLIVRLIKILVVTAAIAASFVLLWLFYDPKLDHPREPANAIPVIPENFRTVGLIFYGRRSRVEILDCYLKQNLKENGGPLDEVVFLARTDNFDDLRYLDQLVKTSERYSRRNLTEYNNKASKVTYGQAWDVVERGIMYVKIDDDIMFIEKGAIASLITTKVTHPEHLLISSNTINSPRLAWLHSHLGAIHPYLPELSTPPSPPQANITWRASDLPPWDGNPTTYSLPQHPSPPHPNHRWLSLPSSYGLAGTPISTIEYTTTTAAITNWAVAAQEHYSFLQNLEEDDLDVYKFGLWDMQGTRLQVNLIAIWGDDVVDNMPVAEDDEKFLTVELPRRLGRNAVVDGGALASHFAFRHQSQGMEATDLLGRYRGYVEEMVCGTL